MPATDETGESALPTEEHTATVAAGGVSHGSTRAMARGSASPKPPCCGCSQALAAMQAKFDQLQVQVDRQNRQQVEADQDRQRDNLMLTGEVSTIRRVITAAGLVLPAPSIGAGYLSVKQYGGEHHLSNSGVMARIYRGQVEATKVGGEWLIKCAK